MMPRPRPYDLTKHDGKTVDWLTHAALLKMERILKYELTITQGCYQALDGKANDVAQSAGTHDGGGVVDLAPWDWQNKVRAGRLSGFVMYHRPAIPGLWPEHCHGVLMGNAKLAPSAQDQVRAYHLGLDGLADHRPDPHAGMVFRGFHWPYGGQLGKVRWVRDQLNGNAREEFEAGLIRVGHGK